MRKVVCGIILMGFAFATPIPVQFSIAPNKVVKKLPWKTKAFGTVIPGELKTYIFKTEKSYYRDYQKSFYALTFKKGGWDCMRHYEILANGCIPYFDNLDACDDYTMHLLPKKLILEAMHLRGVTRGKIDWNTFDAKRYWEILRELLAYTKAHLTTEAMARYMVDRLGYKGEGKILFLSKEVSPDYMRECVLTGFKQIFGERVVDVPKIDYLYTSYGDATNLYGKGFSYSKVLEDLPIDRSKIEKRIKNREFDLVIYGSVHRGLPYHELVKSVYGENEIAYVCGADEHPCEFLKLNQLFLREFDFNLLEN
ncbi:MAG: hypothetical protein SP1CHLAM54_10150 [Chlamydiia bacterium]|nr:hypothetical protein [Chlamydiia bacterium]MCH9615921.1 hypothetical protein [Chlamydiia bacterium]MCH9628676.1 hypothetical protein [Chlamydiia bacterium]